MAGGDMKASIEDKAGRLQGLLLNWVLPIGVAFTLIRIWWGVSQGWERGAVFTVVLLVCAYFIGRSFYHFSRKQFRK